MELHIHGNAQDQLGQILKQGLLVIHGDAGQCFLRGQGSTTYVLVPATVNKYREIREL
jgi:formylmethanofuran dehydrogenase subunit C